MGIDPVIRRGAVLLDRDGVINRNVYYTDTREWESPRLAGDVELLPGAAGALRRLRAAGYVLIVVSNQPSYAKGKTTLEDLRAVHATIVIRLKESDAVLDDAFYCYHHPKGVVPGFSGPCECRKPSPYFARQAALKHDFDLRASWFIGDRGTDVECGRAAGSRTIQIARDPSPGEVQAPRPDRRARDLAAAANLILAG